MNKYSLWAVIIGGITSILVLLFLSWWMFFRVSYIVYAEDTVIEGNFVITEEQPVLLKNNAKLTIKGDAVLAGELTCKNGGVQLEVDGFLSLANEINCDEDPQEVAAENAGVSIVAKGGLMMGKDAIIDSEGSVQIVDVSEKVATSQEAIDKVFDQVEVVATAGVQIGPLSNEEEAQSFGTPKEVAPVSKGKPLPFIDTANAQVSDLEEQNVGDVLDLIAKIEAANLTPDQMQQLNEMLFALSLEQTFKQEGQLVKNLKSVMDVERFLHQDALTKADSFLLNLRVNQTELDYLAWLVDEFLQDKGKTPPVIIGGTIKVGSGQKPPEEIDLEKVVDQELGRRAPKKIVLNFDFSDNRGVALSDLTIKGPNGAPAASGVSSSCEVSGDNGGNAMRFNVRAHNLRVANFTIEMGSGGDGASVATPASCEEASALAGDGGKPGNIKMYATGRFEIAGGMTIIPGAGGHGGLAKATTKDAAQSCPGKNSGDAEAIGGNGGDSMQKLRIRGSIGGVDNITIAAAHGGNGGDAFAESGEGGHGQSCGCNGGNGGEAYALAGDGGNAAPSANGLSTGGDGGEAIANAGNAGFGGSCRQNEGPAGGGGAGGNAIADAGLGGTGDIRGTDGPQGLSRAGDGGNGGDGCNEGLGGPAGQGSTASPGEKGKRLCTVPPQEEENLVSLPGTDPNSMYELEVIPFDGSAIPIFLIRKGQGQECDQVEHWHGTGVIKMINAGETKDPLPDGCGFGKTAELPSRWVPVNHATMVGLYGNGVEQYLRPTGDDEGGSMVQLCMVGGAWVECPGQ